MTTQTPYSGTGTLGWEGPESIPQPNPFASQDSFKIFKFSESQGRYVKGPGEVSAGLYRTSGEWKRLQEDFREIETDCANDDWDGEGAPRISKDTIAQARRFIELLPPFLPLPDIAPEADGQINLGWYVDSDFLVDISIDKNGVLYYAGRFKGQKNRGSSQLVSTIPGVVMDQLLNFRN